MTTDPILFDSVWAGRAALALVLLMFAFSVAYTVWVIVLDIREQREHDEAGYDDQ